MNPLMGFVGVLAGLTRPGVVLLLGAKGAVYRGIGRAVPLIALSLLQGLALLLWPLAAPGGSLVVCTAEHGYHCDRERGGCVKDATYVTTYDVDLEGKQIRELTVQHTKRDREPRPGSAVYTILQAATSTSGERQIVAIGQVGASALEMILVGTQSYLSTSVSTSIPRIFSMIGRCAWR
jgi:hypothetical protein